jgi:hypothetical protein
MKRFQAWFMAATVSVLGVQVQAHGDHHILGTVKRVGGGQLVLTLKDGKEQTIALAKGTMVMRGAAMVGLDQVKPGVRVVVSLTEDDRAAAHIKLGPA